MQITARQLWGTKTKFTGLAGGHRPLRLIQNESFQTANRAANGNWALAQNFFFYLSKRRPDRAFRGPVEVPERDLPFEQFRCQICGQRFAAADKQSQAQLSVG